MGETKSWLAEKAIETGVIDGYKYYIVPAPAFGKVGALNGYIVFPKKPLIEDGYNGLATYVPVHGGITFAEHVEGEGMVYGFDTLHYQSELLPVEDKEWIREQIKFMLKGILVAKGIERKYLKCLTNKGKAKYAQMVSDVQPDQSMNTSVMINLLAGKL